MQRNLAKWENGLAFLITMAVFVVVAFRAYNVSITHDEVLTFFKFVQTGKVWPAEGLWDANNHFLNTWLSRLSFLTFGSSELALRLPSLLGALIFILYAWRWAAEAHSAMIRWALYIGLISCSFLAEFFALSRGYGLSIALMTAGLFHLTKWSSAQNIGQLLIGLALLSLAAFANLSLLMLLPITILWAVAVTWLGANRKQRIMEWATLVLFGVLPLTGLAMISMKLRSEGLLYYGTDDGFVDGTLRSLGMCLIAPWHGDIGFYLLCALLLFNLAMWSVVLWLNRNGVKELVRIMHLPGLVLGSIAASVVMHHLMGVKYPLDRAALFLVPLLMLALAQGLNRLQQPSYILQVLFAAVLAVFPIHMTTSWNLDRTVLWHDHANVDELFKKAIEEYGVNPQRANFGISVNNLAKPSVMYYSYREGGPASLFPAWRYADFIIAQESEVSEANGMVSIYNDPISGLHLFRRKTPLTEVLVKDTVITQLTDSHSEFIKVLQTAAVEWRGKSVRVLLEGALQTDEVPEIWLVAAVYNSAGIQSQYEFIELDKLHADWDKGTGKLSHQIMLPTLPEDAQNLNIYFWNINTQSIHMGDARVRLWAIAPN